MRISWNHLTFLGMFAAGLGTQSILIGQTLRLSAATGTPGGLVEAEILLDSPSGREPLGLQWTVLWPSAQLTREGEGSRLGGAAKDAGKGLRCAEKKNEAGTHLSMCIVSGGQKTIPNGSVALLKFRIPPNATPGLAKIRIEKCLAVSKNLKRVSIPVAEGGVTIRPK